MATSTTDPLELFESYTSYFDIAKFPSIKTNVFKLVDDPALPSAVGIIICNWFFRTIYRLYKPTPKELKKLLNKASKCHYRAKNIIAKGTYLNYIDVNSTTKLAGYFYGKRFGDDRYFVLQLSNDVVLVNNLNQDSAFTPERLLKHFCKWIKRAALDEQRSNLLDVLLLNYKSDPRVEEIFQEMRYDDSANTGLYGDRQNVHDEEVSAAALVAAEALMKWYADNKIPDEEINNDFQGDRGAWVRCHLESTDLFEEADGQKTLDLVITRLTLDQASFGSAFNKFSIMQFIMALLHFIFGLTSYRNLYPTIKEEFREMRELCSSGYVERGIAILQGVPGAEEFEIRISERKRLFSAVAAKLSEVMKKAPENVILGSCDPGLKGVYLEYLERKINELLPSLNHFGDVLEDLLVDVIEDYSDEKGWSFSDGVVSRPGLDPDLEEGEEGTLAGGTETPP